MKKTMIAGLMMLIPFVFSAFTAEYTGSGQKTTRNDSLEKDRARYIALINEQIKGKENRAVDSVFVNLKVLGGFPAENLVFAMDAWSRALGVSCGHCHNTGNFASDEKHRKEISRQMVEMGNLINEKLKTIQGISQRPYINCITCHRGALKPATRLP